MKPNLRYILFVFFTLSYSALGAQRPFFKSHLSKSLDLSLMHLPEGGFIWLSAREGLIRYDGQDYKTYTNQDSLSKLEITAIYRDRRNKLWAGGKNGRIYFINETDSLALWTPEEGLPKVAVTGFAEDDQNNFWFSTYGEGLYFWNGRRLYNYGEEDGLLGLDIYDLAADTQGRIWAATDGGLSICWIEDGEKKIRNISRKDGLPDEIIRCVLPDGRGNCWIGTYDEGFCFVRGEDFAIEHPVKDWNLGIVNSLEWVDDRELWIGTESGLWRYRLSDQKILRVDDEKQSEAKIYDLRKDIEGNMWVLNNREGLLSTNCHFEFIQDKINHTQAILQDDTGKFWIGTQEGLYWYFPDKKEAEQFQRLSEENVLSLYQDRFTNVWAGTFGNGALIFDVDAKQSKWLREEDGLNNGSILSIDGSERKIWLATLGGVTELNGERNPFRETNLILRNLTHETGLGANYIYKVFVDSKNRTWFATDGKGIGVLEGDQLTNYTAAAGTSFKSVYAIAEDQNNNIWFSTAREGLFKYDGRKFTHFDKTKGLRDLNISGLIADKEGKIMIVHSTGIDFFDPSDKQFIYYDSEVGIEELEPNLNALFQDENDYIWIGAQKDIIRYAPLSKELKLKPQIHLNGVSVNLKPVGVQSGREFNYRQNNLVFEYVGLWYTDPASVRYHYQLKGFNRQWIRSMDKRAVYSNLPAGEYTFLLSATESEFTKPESVLTYDFRIKPPFWRQSWFIILVVFKSVGLIYFFIRIREKRLQWEAQLKKEKLESQLEALKSQINPHFLFNNFNTLAAIIEEDPALAVEYVEQLSDFYRRILQYRQKDMIPLIEEIDLVNNYVFLLKKRYGDHLNLKMATDGKNRALIAPLTLQMLLENAVKHNIISQTKPLEVHVFKDNNDYLVVKNNLQKKITLEKSTGFGLQSIRKRYALLTNKKVITEESKDFFCVKIPLVVKNQG